MSAANTICNAARSSLESCPRAELADDLAAIEILALRPVHSAEELAANLSEVYDAVFNVNFDRYDVHDLAKSAPDLRRDVTR